MAAEMTHHTRESRLSSSTAATGSGERILLALVVVFTAAVALLLAAGWIDLGRLGIFGPLFAPLLRAARVSPTSQMIVVLCAVAVGLFAALVVLRSLGGGRKRTRIGARTQRHVLVADDQGLVVIDGTGVATVAEAAAKRVPGVANVRVAVSGSGSAPVRLSVTASVSAAAELRKVGDDVRQRAAEAVRQLVGIDVAEVVVNIDVVPLEQLGRDLQ